MAQEIVVIGFDDADKANELLNALLALQDRQDIDFDDAVVVVKDEEGNAKLQQSMDLTPGKGAFLGGLGGMIVGALLLAPIGGALLGVGVGALIGKLTDAGLSDEWIKEVSEAIPAGGSGLFLLVNFAKRDVVLTEVRNSAVGGKIINTTLSDEAAAAFQDALTKSRG